MNVLLFFTERLQVKLLLLGAGESGKSTFLKQMRIIHGIKFEPELLREYQHVIYQNIVRGMQVLVDAREKLDIEWGQASNESAAEEARKFLHGNDLDTESFQIYAPTLHILWQDRAIRTAYDRRREFQIVSAIFAEFRLRVELTQCACFHFRVIQLVTFLMKSIE